MTRVYWITYGATIIKTQDSAEIIEQEQVMTVRGAKVQYVKPHGDLLFCQILAANGDVVFSGPAHAIKSVWTPTYPDELPPEGNKDNVIPFPNRKVAHAV